MHTNNKLFYNQFFLKQQLEGDQKIKIEWTNCDMFII